MNELHDKYEDEKDKVYQAQAAKNQAAAASKMQDS